MKKVCIGDKRLPDWQALWTGYKCLYTQIYKYEGVVLYQFELYNDFYLEIMDFDNQIQDYNRLSGFKQEILWE